MSDFSDIERFARSHAACGGITPNATTQLDGGYLLTLTCSCGASMDRWITPEEAEVPLSFSGAGAAPPAPLTAPASADATPSAPVARTDLEEVMRQALEAEEAADARIRAAPPAGKPAAPPPVAKPLAAAAPVKAVTPPSVAKPTPPPAAAARVPITNLEEAVQRALEADASAAAAESAAARPRQRAAPPRLNAAAAVQRALDSQTTTGVAPPATPSRFWFGALVVALVIGGVVLWLGLRMLEEDARRGTSEGGSTMRAPAPSDAQRAAFATALGAVRRLSVLDAVPSE